MKPNKLKALLPVTLFVGIAISVVLGIRQGFEQSKQPLVDPSHPKAIAGSLPVVTLYSTDWCSYCKAARTYFTRKQIPFIENDIEKNAVAYQQYEQLGGNGVPFITIDKQRIQGFDRAAFKVAYFNALGEP